MKKSCCEVLIHVLELNCSTVVRSLKLPRWVKYFGTLSREQLVWQWAGAESCCTESAIAERPCDSRLAREGDALQEDATQITQRRSGR